MLNHEKLFAAALQINEPMYVKNIEFDQDNGELHIYIDFKKGAKFTCPICGLEDLDVHDTDEKTWRHLNFFQYKAYLHCRTPRTKCPKDGVHLTTPAWAAPGSGFTLLFEAFVLQLTMYMPVLKVAVLLNEHDTLLWRIVRRYVDQARKEADYSGIKDIGVDETSSKKHHSYVTLFVDIEKSRVVHVAKGKDASTISSFKEMLENRDIPVKQIKNICADMSPAFRSGIQKYFPEAELTYDKFHVIKLMNEALDKVRRSEQSYQNVLKNSRYVWLHNPKNLTVKQSKTLENLSCMNLKTGRAYRIKLSLQDIYNNVSGKDNAYILLKKWYGWAFRSRLEPVREFARTVKNNWAGIINYFDTNLTNGVLEGMNSIVQLARNRARGYRNVDTFITMIYLLGGKLNLGVQRV